MGPEPTPAPTPVPSPSHSDHYGRPPCLSDEKQITIDGIAGSACSARCSSYTPCPTDVPTGVTAYPSCSLRDESTGYYQCALQCNYDQDCDQANGAYCGHIQGYGFCVYSAMEKTCAKPSDFKPVSVVPRLAV